MKEDKSIHDKFESEQYVDEISLEDLKIEQREEKNKRKSQDSSSSEQKYAGEEE